MSKETAEIRDQLGMDPDVTPIIKANYYEEVGIEEGPLRIQTEDQGTSFILGHSTKGTLGEGNSNVLGDYSDTAIIVGVINNNNTYIERFTFTIFKDATNTTANWDTTNGKVVF